MSLKKMMMGVLAAQGGGSSATMTVLAKTKKSQLGGANTPAIDTTGATLLVALVSDFTSINPIADSEANTWTKAETRTAGGEVWAELWYCIAPTTSASHTFTSALNFGSIVVLAFTGATATYVDSSINGSTSATSLQAGSISLTAPALCITTLSAIQDPVPIVDEGYSVEEHQDTAGGYTSSTIAWKIATTGSSTDPEWTIPAAGYLTPANITFTLS